LDGRGAVKAWLVTYFITLGNPLTHAHFLICRGNNERDLQEDCRQRVHEREFPVYPPVKRDEDGLLAFKTPAGGRQVHHGAMFGLTRWTNLYFPAEQLFWGDAIGGPVAHIFGKGIFDVEVYLEKGKVPHFFTHTNYWTKKGDPSSPHIVLLRNAIDLADTGIPNKLSTLTNLAGTAFN
jgi:hypothetical protein